jgi:hypothetical protein
MDNKKENNMNQARQAYSNGDYEKAHKIWLTQAEDGSPEAQGKVQVKMLIKQLNG